MKAVVLGLAFAGIAAGSASAQSYCPQVRQAVATYGYEAAKRYALANYTPEQVRAAERCLHTARVRHGIAARGSY